MKLNRKEWPILKVDTPKPRILDEDDSDYDTEDDILDEDNELEKANLEDEIEENEDDQDTINSDYSIHDLISKYNFSI